MLADNNDYHDLDPQIVFTAPATGSFIVRAYAFPAAPDSTIAFAGGDAFIYRLTITTEAFIEHAFPLAVSRVNPGEVDLIGWNIPEAIRKAQVSAVDGALAGLAFNEKAANSATVRLEPHATVAKAITDKNNPQKLTLPTTVSGMLDTPHSPDRYQFEAKKGQKLTFQLETRSLGFPLTAVLRLTDANGKVLSRVEEPAPQQAAAARDLTLNFTPPKDGSYRVEVADLHGHSGPRYAYCLRALPAQADYQLSLAADRFSLTPGKPLEIPVTIERHEGVAGEIELTVEGLPQGVSAAPVKVKAADKKSKVVLTAEATAASGPIRIVGKVAGNADLSRTALFSQAAPRTVTPHIWLTIIRSAK